MESGPADGAGVAVAPGPTPEGHVRTVRAARAPVRRRRAALVVVPLVLAALVGPILYLQGGSRLGGAGGGVGAPVQLGQELHASVFLDTGGGTVELVSARPLGATPDLEVEVALIASAPGAPGIGSVIGPLDEERYRPVPLEGHQLRTSHNPGDDEERYHLDLRLVPTSEGIHHLLGIEVTYRSGFLRERTAVLSTPVCVSASSHPLEARPDWPDIECPIP